MDIGGDDGRGRAVEVVARESENHSLWNWREAVRALSSEPLPERLRHALVELGAQGRRFRLAVEAYEARVVRAMADPEERERPVVASQRWPEYGERSEAREAYVGAREAVSVMARAWVEGTVPA